MSDTTIEARLAEYLLLRRELEPDVLRHRVVDRWTHVRPFQARLSGSSSSRRLRRRWRAAPSMAA